MRAVLALLALLVASGVAFTISKVASDSTPRNSTPSTSGWVSTARDADVFLGLVDKNGTLSGTYASLSIEPQDVTIASYGAGALSGTESNGAVTLNFSGDHPLALSGTISADSMTLAVPQSGGPIENYSFRRGTSSDYNAALPRVRALAGNFADHTCTIGHLSPLSPGSYTDDVRIRVSGLDTTPNCMAVVAASGESSEPYGAAGSAVKGYSWTVLPDNSVPSDDVAVCVSSASWAVLSKRPDAFISVYDSGGQDYGTEACQAFSNGRNLP